MTDCPPRLRGDLSKWLCEINAGVYVGQVSGRVREAIWDRVCKNLKNGRATMVFTTNGEQRMDFRVYNTNWVPVDFDGIKLMRRPLPQTVQPAENLKPGFSLAAKRQMAQRARSSQQRKGQDTFVIIDLETTGLDSAKDSIIEFAAIRVTGEEQERLSTLVQFDGKLPGTIVSLTGITDRMLSQQGMPPEQAVEQFLKFIGRDKLIGYNISFDMGMLRAACEKYGKTSPINRCKDLLELARRKVYGVENYKLSTLADYFSLSPNEKHRALDDCELMLQLYCKLNEI